MLAAHVVLTILAASVVLATLPPVAPIALVVLAVHANPAGHCAQYARATHLTFTLWLFHSPHLLTTPSRCGTCFASATTLRSGIWGEWMVIRRSVSIMARSHTDTLCCPISQSPQSGPCVIPMGSSRGKGQHRRRRQRRQHGPVALLLLFSLPHSSSPTSFASRACDIS
jgi:hypothetical protein